MRVSDILAASLVAPFVAAHGDHIPGLPKIFGRASGLVPKVRGRSTVEGHATHAVPQQAARLNARQQGGNAEHRCGPEFEGAVCAEGYCCSGSGWCGQGSEYCQAPDCLFKYGPGCDANKLPSGGSTRNIARPKLGKLPYGGAGIYACNDPGKVAITYDDGPYVYTGGVLDMFAEKGFKATFFITGINIGKGSIDDESTEWPGLIRRMVDEGHQVASHTWSHQNLSDIGSEARYEQMVRNEMAFSNIIGKFPTYMRPPYSACDEGCQQDLEDLGYVVSYFDLDTDDYNNVTPEKIQNAKNNFDSAILPSNPNTDDFLVIGHDIHEQTAKNLTRHMLDLLSEKGYQGVTMGECLGDPEANWYRDASSGRVATSSVGPSPTTSPTQSATSGSAIATATGVTSDGTCGSVVGLSCIGWKLGRCCSTYGWCGSSPDHCGDGCQTGFGTCGSSSESSTTPASTTPAPSSTPISTPVSVPTSAPSATPTGTVSPDGTCGGENGYTCQGSEHGDCCSQYGWCGATPDYCDTGCNPLFGKCNSAVDAEPSPIVSSTSAAPTSAAPTSATPTSTAPSSTAPSSTAPTSTAPTSTPTGAISLDGTCGGEKGYTCEGSGLGDCCSQYGFCGTTEAYCDAGCNPLFGKCGSVALKDTPSSPASSKTPSSTTAPITTKASTAKSSTTKTSTKVATKTSTKAPTKTPTSRKSPDGTCGSSKGYTCNGYKYGECCSSAGWCGSTKDHCNSGCNSLYGKCGSGYVKSQGRW